MFDESRIVNRLLPASWRAVSGELLLFVGVDRRRPASWITFAMGGWLGWWCAAATADQSGGIAMLSAAVLAVAAIGDIPLAVCLPADRGRQFLWGCAWACERAAWPLVGVMLGMLAAGGVRDSFEPGSFGMLAAATAGALFAAITTVSGRLAGGKAADAASLTLLLAAVSAAAGTGLASWRGSSGVGGGVAWLLLGGLGWAWSRSQRTAIEVVLPGSPRSGLVAGADVLHVDAFPANGPLRQTLSRLAMVAALVAMAGWLMLEPGFDPAAEGGHEPVGQQGQLGQLVLVHRAAVAWALFTAAWFIGLAVPQATLQDGMGGSRGWDRLFRTTPGAGRSGPAWWPGLWAPRVGPVRFAGGVALTQAAILGWPVLVCTVLSLPNAAAARLPLGIVIGLAAAAAVVSAIVWLGNAVHASRETLFAAALAIVVGVLAITVDVTFSADQLAPPASPSLPSLVPPPLHRLGGG